MAASKLPCYFLLYSPDPLLRTSTGVSCFSCTFYCISYFCSSLLLDFCLFTYTPIHWLCQINEILMILSPQGEFFGSFFEFHNFYIPLLVIIIFSHNKIQILNILFIISLNLLNTVVLKSALFYILIRQNQILHHFRQKSLKTSPHIIFFWREIWDSKQCSSI